MGKKHKPEEIIGKLREAEIVLAQGGTTANACRRIAGTIVAITPPTVNGTVKVDIGGGNVVTSSITEEAIADLALAVGDAATVIVKSSDVLMGK